MKTRAKKFILIFVLFSTQYIYCQDLSNIKGSKPFELKGSISAGLSSINSTRNQTEQNSLFYSTSIAPIFKFYGVEIPVSVTFSNRQTTFQQPFNRYGASIKYKWAKAHVGYRNVFFSDYTLASRTIVGGGFEINPSILRVGFMMGKINNKIEINNNQVDEVTEPKFERKIMAFKLGLGKSNNYFDINVLKGSDIYSPAQLDSNRKKLVTPEENFVASVHIVQKIYKYFNIDIEGAGSFYTKNKVSPEMEYDFVGKDIVSKLIKTNISTQANYAIKGKFDIQLNQFNTSLTYRYVMPDFKSMGSYFFNTDIREIAINPSASFIKGKINLAGQFGLQHNNLTKRKIQTSDRVIYGLNMTLSAIKNLNISAYFNNNKTELVNVQADRLLDSFNLTQNNLQIGTMITYMITKNSNNQNISMSFNHNNFEILSLYDPSNTLSFNNVSNSVVISYNYKWKKSKLGFGSQINYFGSSNNQNSTSRIGLNINANKSFYKTKLNVRLGIGYAFNYLDHFADGSSIRTTFNLGYALAKKHNISLQTDIFHRNYKIQNKLNVNDYRSSLRYVYNF